MLGPQVSVYSPFNIAASLFLILGGFYTKVWVYLTEEGSKGDRNARSESSKACCA